MDPLITEGLIGLATVVLAPLLTWLLGGRRRVKVDTFTAITSAQSAELARQDSLLQSMRGDIDALEAKLAQKDEALTAERDAHAVTRAALARMQDIVRRYFQRVRDAWAKGESMPAPDPVDLDWLAQSGTVIAPEKTDKPDVPASI